ncbi:MAG: Gfo/Idh/MocA family oxidoreductase [Planctomycetes bacterium]|nr:Gfo/Idh/MocA family oxidoreductase [Planctomycetota bacterium]MCB9887348.1 Gfo/Idh/MocA family oxidoreductase [Planctomycetota bacterium]
MKPAPFVSTRREFLATSGGLAAASVLARSAAAGVHVGGSDTIRVALVGCGGRGGGAATNALAVPGASLQLAAVADVFAGKPADVVEALMERFGDRANVPAEHQFVGFDGYRKAMDCLRPGDIVILTTPPAFRWVHYAYAIEKGLNVFMEKPVAVDGPTSKRMLELNEKAKQKGLRVGVGLMSRHNYGMRELRDRIANGEIGDIVMMRGYRMHGPAAFFRSLPKPEGISELMYQIQRFHSFLWASGGNFSDFNIHIVDHLCWMKGSWPIAAQAVGGRHYRQSEEGVYIDQNFDTYAVEYTFADGSKMFFDGRCIPGCKQIYSSYAHGTKGMAVVSANGDCGLPSSTYRAQTQTVKDRIWQSDVPRDQQDPYQNEWNELIAAIVAGKEYNEVETGVKTSLVTAMGRMAAHTGQEISYEQILNGDHEFAPDVDKLTLDSPAPLLAGPDGKYPVPMPGMKKLREY